MFMAGFLPRNPGFAMRQIKSRGDRMPAEGAMARAGAVRNSLGRGWGTPLPLTSRYWPGLCGERGVASGRVWRDAAPLKNVSRARTPSVSRLQFGGSSRSQSLAGSRVLAQCA